MCANSKHHRARLRTGRQAQCSKPRDIHLDVRPVEGTTDTAAISPEGMTLEQWEDEIIREALRRANGNKSQAARLLGSHATHCAIGCRRLGLRMGGERGVGIRRHRSSPGNGCPTLAAVNTAGAPVPMLSRQGWDFAEHDAFVPRVTLERERQKTAPLERSLDRHSREWRKGLSRPIGLKPPPRLIAATDSHPKSGST